MSTGPVYRFEKFTETVRGYLCVSLVLFSNFVHASGLPNAPTPARSVLKPTIFGESSVLPSNTALAPLMTVPMESLNFGRFVPGDTPGTVTITPEGMRTATGGVLLLFGDSGHPARFMVKGERDRSFHIKFSDTASEKGERLTLISRFTTAMLTDGSKIISVGGTLHVPARAKPGLVTTGFQLVTDYN